ncbi:hypothetical protein B5E65_05775 [Gemmiger sp. An120]|nr:hypothetical protein B5E65_05775 [Gemmiger sp. An120]
MQVLDVKNLRIAYPVGDVLDIGLKETVIRKIKRDFQIREFVAVDNVSFSLKQGDMLGIIGHNGAGKSTLAKAIAGVVKPTCGTIARGGKVTALLELSAGFDPDLTVRENTILRAAMMGYSKEYALKAYDHIIQFAELQGFEERSFKQLSSGMKARLGFSIASLVDPEILILDEVLSVGDSGFRKKSEKRMKEIIGGGAVTLLISHSMRQVQSLCNKILWLDHGRQIAFTDKVELYCTAYEEFMRTKELPKTEEDVVRLAHSYTEWKQSETERAARIETKKLEAILENGKSEAAVKAAVAILRKQRPELLA